LRHGDSKRRFFVGGDTTQGGFDRYGVRVTTYDHTSITRFIEAGFKVPALTARDANADPLMDLFDFSSPAFATPPTLPDPAVNPGELAYCIETLTKP
jgi:hypothetical protein